MEFAWDEGDEQVDMTRTAYYTNDLEQFRGERAKYMFRYRRIHMVHFFLEFLRFSKENQTELRKFQVNAVLNICYAIKNGISSIKTNFLLGITGAAGFRKKPFRFTIILQVASGLYIYCKLNNLGVSLYEIYWAIREYSCCDTSSVSMAYLSSALHSCHEAFIISSAENANSRGEAFVSFFASDAEIETFRGGNNSKFRNQFEPHMFLDRWFAILQIMPQTQKQVIPIYNGILKFIDAGSFTISQNSSNALFALSISLFVHIQTLREEFENEGLEHIPKMILDVTNDVIKLIEFVAVAITGGYAFDLLHRLYKNFIVHLLELLKNLFLFNCSLENISDFFYAFIPHLSLLVDYKMKYSAENNTNHFNGSSLPMTFVLSQRKRLAKLKLIQIASERIDKINPHLISNSFRTSLQTYITESKLLLKSDLLEHEVKVLDSEILNLQKQILNNFSLEEILERKNT
jgi:hypothetical protein